MLHVSTSLRPLIFAPLLVSFVLPAAAGAYTRGLGHFRGETSPAQSLWGDCVLQDYNICSSWIWQFEDTPGAVWGAVFDPNDCPGGCWNGGAVTEVILYARCQRVPGEIGGVRVVAVDAGGCPTSLIYESGPLALTHCVRGDRWSTIPIGSAHLGGNPFAVQIVWGPQGDVRLATDNALANLFCSLDYTGTFPGCFSEYPTCPGWRMPPQASFIFVTDWDGDTVLDDLCSLLGKPSPLSFPYLPGYGLLNNSLIMSVGLDCGPPYGVENTSWGRVRALFE